MTLALPRSACERRAAGMSLGRRRRINPPPGFGVHAQAVDSSVAITPDAERLPGVPTPERG